jgi:hypothetical protein
VSTEIDFIDTYVCPHCRANLVSGSTGWPGWQRCPVCGFASLPPGSRRYHSPTRKRADAAADQVDFATRDPAEDDLSRTDPMTTQVIVRAPHSSPTRLIFKTGLLASVALTFVAFLDHRTTHSLVFGSLAVVFLLLVLGGPGSRAASTVVTAKKD